MTGNSLGTYLKSLRKSNGYSQEFVASSLNIIRQTYSHYETGRIIPPVDSYTILQCCIIFPPMSCLAMQWRICLLRRMAAGTLPLSRLPAVRLRLP